MWSLGYARRRRAVLRALTAVGDPGMSVFALGVALDLSETSLQQVLDSMLRSGDVDTAAHRSRATTVTGSPRYRINPRLTASPLLLLPF